MSFFQELKERRLVQVVFSYLAAGWIALEVVSQLTEHAVLPQIAYYVALIWYLSGIPAAFLIGWHHGEKGKQRAPRSEVLILLVIAVSAVALSGFTVTRLTAPVVDLADYGPDMNRVAVLYFEDHTPGAANQHVAEGLTEALIEQLGSVPALDVISRNGVAPYHGSDLPRDSIASALAAGTLVSGILETAGDRLQLTLQLYDGASGAPLPDGRVRLEPRAPENLMAIVDEIGAEASRLLRAKLGDHVQIARRSAETNLTAWTLIQRAERLRRDAEGHAAHGDLHTALERFDQAHELLASAQDADSLQAEPTVLRSEIEYRKSRLTAGHELETVRFADRGIELAEEALAIAPGDPRALASRGTLRYWKYLLNVVHDDREQQWLLEQGRDDLERAVRLDPTLAGAHSVLSHLYFRTESITRGVLAAQRAYDADAYLEAADGIVWRLYSGNFDLENWTEARKWCEIGQVRFPHDPGLAGCRLDLMIAGAIDPDPQHAWEVVSRLEEAPPAPNRDYERLNARLTAAGVLARAGLQDSARAVLDRTAARITHDVDVGNDLRWLEARIRILTGEEDRAIDLLGRLIAADPDHAFGTGAEVNWAWRPLLDHPRFQELRRVGN